MNETEPSISGVYSPESTSLCGQAPGTAAHVDTGPQGRRPRRWPHEGPGRCLGPPPRLVDACQVARRKALA